MTASFDAVIDRVGGEPGVEEGTGFGTMPGLRVGGKIFAMLHDGRLVVKLPAERVTDLVGSGTARPFEIGTRQMREWASVEPRPDWPELAEEALAFVRPA